MMLWDDSHRLFLWHLLLAQSYEEDFQVVCFFLKSKKMPHTWHLIRDLKRTITYIHECLKNGL